MNSVLSAAPVTLARVSNPVRLLQVTDLHLLAHPDERLMGVDTAHTFVAVVDHAVALGFAPDLVLVTGDIAQSADARCYERCRVQINRLGAPQFWLQGNHDLGQVFDPAQLLAPTEHRVIHCGPWTVLMLDSSVDHEVAGHFGPSDLAWLATQLQQHRQSHVLVALHHHPLPVGSLWLDQHMLKNAADFWNILDQHPQVRLVLHGHVHQAVDCWRGNVRVLATPSTCFQFAPGQDSFLLDECNGPGFRCLTLLGDGGIDTQVHRLAGVAIGQQQHPDGY